MQAGSYSNRAENTKVRRGRSMRKYEKLGSHVFKDRIPVRTFDVYKIQQNEN